MSSISVNGNLRVNSSPPLRPQETSPTTNSVENQGKAYGHSKSDGTDDDDAAEYDNSATSFSSTVQHLRDHFNKQFSDLKAQHEAETNALLEKFNEVTEQLKTLSEQSAEQINALTDQLGAQLGTVLNKLDLLGKGQNLSLRSIGLFNLAAKSGNGALDKLIEIIGRNSTGNQLRSVQSRLQSVAARFAGEQVSNGLNLLA